MAYTEQKNLIGMTLADCVNYLEGKLGEALPAPELPESDGTYILTLEITSGTPVISWVAAEE